MNLKQKFNLELMVISLLFLLFFRTGIALRLSGPFDEACYLSRAEQWVGLASQGCEGKSHFPGIAILWIPAAFVGRVVAFFLGANPSDWIAAFCGLSSFLFWIGTWKIIKALFKHFKISVPSWVPFGVLLNIPVLYYAFARALLAHSGEVFIAFLYVLMVIRKRLWSSLFLLLLLFLIRPNNWGAFLFLVPQLVSGFHSTHLKERQNSWILGVGLVLWVFLFLAVFIRFGLFTGYHGTFLIPVLMDWQPRSLLEFFFRTDHGVFWNQFLWVGVFVFSIIRFNVLNDLEVAALFWMMSSALSAIFWPTYGSSFGYRYILGAYAPALFICLNFWSSKKTFGPPLKKLMSFVLLLGAFWSLNLYWISTAPPPLWPWTDPFLTQLSPPYSVLTHWFTHTQSLVKMISFSSIWQMVQWFSGKEIFLNFSGTKLPYFFEGDLKKFTLFLTVTVFMIFGVSAVNVFRQKLKEQ